MDDQGRTSLNSSIMLTLILTLEFECWLNKLVKVLGFMELNRGSSPIASSGKPLMTDSDFSGHPLALPINTQCLIIGNRWTGTRAGRHMTTPPETTNGRQ